jgi:16S rRNA (guanine966-N2)-methyltransferase
VGTAWLSRPSTIVPVVSQRRSAGARAATPTHEVRLIGGRWKRSKLPVLDRPGLRPTPDRVRETLFNWLGQDLSGLRVLDAFAGSGALGLEAASRGASAVLMLERDAGLVRHLQGTVVRLGADCVEVRTADALAWMRGAFALGQQFDLIFVDPPFSAGVFEPALAAAAPLLAEQGLLYLEADREFDASSLPAGYTRWRHGRAGMVHYHLLRYESVAPPRPLASPLRSAS